MTDVADKVDSLFRSASDSPKLSEDRHTANFKVQVTPLDAPAFEFEIEGGEFKPRSGTSLSQTDQDALCIIEVEPCLREVFSGETTLGNMLFEHRIRIPGYRNKEPLIGAFSRFLRLAVWATIPGAGILRPAK